MVVVWNGGTTAAQEQATNSTEWIPYAGRLKLTALNGRDGISRAFLA